ncbi:MAG: alpha/beta fold hydrolase [Myxococcota bacterium]
MQEPRAANTRAWLDRDEYPFESHFLDLEAGRLHYVDEGSGEPIVMVHGQPTWSFMYRKQIRDLSRHFRCIAVDHLGFGLSDKPPDWTYRIDQHADHLARLVERLDLQRVNLLVHDWGGPIGLAWAVAHPERVERLLLLNTWMGSMESLRSARIFSRLLGSAPGQWATRHLDLFIRLFMKRALAEEGRWERVGSQYSGPFESPADRTGCAIFPRQILAASPLLRETWDRRSALAEKPALFVWGMKDVAFREPILERLLGAFPRHEVARQPDVGHFVAEEMGSRLSPLIEGFLRKAPNEE